MPSLNDLAKKAGVSPSTASRVMNKYKGAFPISDKTREKVLRIAKEIGYVPNAAAQALRRGKTRTISIIGSSPNFFKISGSTGNFHVEAMAGLMHAAIRRGYHVTLLSGTETDPELGGAFADIGLTDGLLILNRDLDMDSAYVASLRNANKPVMYALDYPDGGDIHYTAPDDVGGGVLAARKIIEAGHTRIAFVRQDVYANIFNKRQAGWEQGMKEGGIGYGKDDIVKVEDIDPKALSDKGITALVCANDSIGRICHHAITEKGLKVPDDLSIVSFSHQSQFRHMEVDYTAVTEPLSTIIAASVDRLVDLIDGKGIKQGELFEYAFRVGETLKKND